MIQLQIESIVLKCEKFQSTLFESQLTTNILLKILLTNIFLKAQMFCVWNMRRCIYGIVWETTSNYHYRNCEIVINTIYRSSRLQFPVIKSSFLMERVRNRRFRSVFMTAKQSPMNTRDRVARGPSHDIAF